MAHFAKVVDGIVTQVNVVDEQYFNENRETRYTGQWVQTSYNTQGGVHLLGGTPLRKNYAGLVTHTVRYVMLFMHHNLSHLGH